MITHARVLAHNSATENARFFDFVRLPRGEEYDNHCPADLRLIFDLVQHSLLVATDIGIN